MKKGKENIKDFLKERLENQTYDFQNDWEVFEQKLDHALYMRRLRRAMMAGAFTLILLGVFIGINTYQILDREFYVPRMKDVNLKQMLQSPVLRNDNNPDLIETSILNKDNNISTNIFLEEGTVNSTLSVYHTRDQPAVIESDGHNDQKVKTSVADISTSSEKPKKITLASLGSSSNSTSASEGELEMLTPEMLQQKILKLNVPELIMAYAAEGEDEQDIRSNNDHRKYTGREVVLAYTLSAPNLRMPISPRKSSYKYEPYVSPLQEENPWSYSLNIYPNFTFRKFKVDEDKRNLIHSDFIDAVKASESGGFSMNIGFEITRRIGLITYLNSGIEYITYRSDVAYNFTNFREENINSAGVIESYSYMDQAEQINFADKNIYHYINIPLTISYQPWATDHIRLNIEVGGSYLHFATAQGRTLNYKTLDIIDLSERDFRNSMASFCMKVGASYYVSRTINIGFEPTLRYFTNTIYTEEYPFYVIPYSVGLNVNLQIKL